MMEPATKLYNNQDLLEIAEGIKKISAEEFLGWNAQVDLIYEALQAVQDNAKDWMKGLVTIV